MIDKSSKISLTYNVRGEFLAKAGKYLNAGESVITLEEPVFTKATCNINLGYEFILNALERPKKPSNRSSQKEWSVFQGWNRLTTTAKLKYAVDKFVQDMDGDNPEWELI